MRLLLLASLGIALALAIRKMNETKRHFEYGTEEQLRERVHSKFASRVPSEKLEKVADSVVKNARKKGTLVEVPGEGHTDASSAAEPG